VSVAFSGGVRLVSAGAGGTRTPAVRTTAALWDTA
jgi:hypothetical protein